MTKTNGLLQSIGRTLNKFIENKNNKNRENMNIFTDCILCN